MSDSKRVLVTGASGGIGSAIALQLGRDGFDVTLHYRNNAAKADSLAQEIIAAGGSAHTVSFDLADRDATPWKRKSNNTARTGAWSATRA